MRRISFIPGATTAGDSIAIPTYADQIALVLDAQIVRIPAAQAAHTHDFTLLAGKGGGAGTGTVVADTTPSIGGVTATIAGSTSATDGGVADSAALTGADPVVAAVPTKVDATHVKLDVNTVLGDELFLDYFAVGELGPTAG